MATRRQFLKAGVLTGAGVLFPWKFGLRRVWGAIPGGTLDPITIPKDLAPLVIPPAMPGTNKGKKRGFDYYEIAVRQFRQHILPTSMGLPPTTVWSYGADDYPGAVESLRVHMRRLREKIELDPSKPEFVVTKAGVGYLLSTESDSSSPAL